MSLLRFSLLSGVATLGLVALTGCEQSEPTAPPPPPAATDFKPETDDIGKPTAGSSSTKGGSDSAPDSLSRSSIVERSPRTTLAPL